MKFKRSASTNDILAELRISTESPSLDSRKKNSPTASPVLDSSPISLSTTPDLTLGEAASFKDMSIPAVPATPSPASRTSAAELSFDRTPTGLRRVPKFKDLSKLEDRVRNLKAMNVEGLDVDSTYHHKHKPSF